MHKKIKKFIIANKYKLSVTTIIVLLAISWWYLNSRLVNLDSGLKVPAAAERTIKQLKKIEPRFFELNLQQVTPSEPKPDFSNYSCISTHTFNNHKKPYTREEPLTFISIYGCDPDTFEEQELLWTNINEDLRNVAHLLIKVADVEDNFAEMREKYEVE